LDYLRRFAFDGIKIDRSFVSGLGRDRTDTAVTASIIALVNHWTSWWSPKGSKRQTGTVPTGATASARNSSLYSDGRPTRDTPSWCGGQSGVPVKVTGKFTQPKHPRMGW
jgi:predicted signal transduction protein with EAL and GGDEF domain